MTTKFGLTALHGKLLNLKTSYSKAKNKSTMFCLRKLSVEHCNYNLNNETSNVLQYGFNNRTNFTQKSTKRHVATKQVPPGSFICPQESETELSTIRNRLPRGAQDFKISHHLSVSITIHLHFGE